MKKILLDTNMLMAVASLKLDIFAEIARICDFKHEIVTLESIENELANLAESGKGKQSHDAKIASQVLHQKKIRILKSDAKYADQAIISAVDSDTIVATQDYALKKKLKAKNIQTISIRQKQYLIMG